MTATSGGQSAAQIIFRAKFSIFTGLLYCFDGRMDWASADLTALPTLIWQALSQASAGLHHPFRTPAVGTVRHGQATLRTVILRQADWPRRQLVFYTDARAAKASDLEKCPQLEWLFYDAGAKVQLRVTARAVIHQRDDLARAAWAALPGPSRFNYCTLRPPGEFVDAPGLAFPESMRQGILTAAGSEAGFQNFAVVVTTVAQIEWLQLGLPWHRRARFQWEAGAWVGRWLVP